VKPLTLQQAREFIAEKSGWKPVTVVTSTGFAFSKLPDYFNADDREAFYWIHKAEAVLNETQWHAYNAHLNHLTLRERLFATVSATAPQRARAFCQVFGFSVEGEG